MQLVGATVLLTQSSRLHFRTALPAGVLTLVLVGWYVKASISAGHPLSGSSAAGLSCGIAAGLIIFFEMLLSPKKWFRRIKMFGPAKYWMAAHIWFGIASFFLAVAHWGLVWSGWLPNTLMFLFVLTILSGLYGWIVQNIVPRWMLRHLPSETIHGQIDHVSQVTAGDARQMLIAVCGPRPSDAGEINPELELVGTGPVIIGAQRNVGRTIGRSAQSRRVQKSPEDAKPLWDAFDEIEPYLLEGAKAESPVSQPQQAVDWFRNLREACTDSSAEAIDMLEQLCHQRRQFDTQKSVHRVLHGWLPIHIGLSVAVTGLLIAHIITALKYW